MDDRLIPYSVHLRRDIYEKLKEAAGQRKASSLVRDAITMIVEGDSQYMAGYKKAMRDAEEVVKRHKLVSSIAISGVPITDMIVEQLTQLTNEAGYEQAKA